MTHDLSQEEIVQELEGLLACNLKLLCFAQKTDIDGFPADIKDLFFRETKRHENRASALLAWLSELDQEARVCVDTQLSLAQPAFQSFEMMPRSQDERLQLLFKWLSESASEFFIRISSTGMLFGLSRCPAVRTRIDVMVQEELIGSEEMRRTLDDLRSIHLPRKS